MKTTPTTPSAHVLSPDAAAGAPPAPATDTGTTVRMLTSAAIGASVVAQGEVITLQDSAEAASLIKAGLAEPVTVPGRRTIEASAAVSQREMEAIAAEGDSVGDLQGFDPTIHPQMVEQAKTLRKTEEQQAGKDAPKRRRKP